MSKKSIFLKNVEKCKKNVKNVKNFSKKCQKK